MDEVEADEDNILARANVALFLQDEDGQWIPLDDGLSQLLLYFEQQEEQSRLVAVSGSSCYINSFLHAGLQMCQLSGTFYSLQLGEHCYGISFTDMFPAIEFTTTLDNCVERLKIKQVMTAKASLPLEVLEATLPPPIRAIEGAKRGSVEHDKVEASTESDKSIHRTNSLPVREKEGPLSPQMLSPQMLRRSSVSVDQLRTLTYKSLKHRNNISKEAKERTPALNDPANISLNNIAQDFENEAMDFIRNVNACVLNPRTEKLKTRTLEKINEMLSMALILTTKSNLSGIIHTQINALQGFIGVIPGAGIAEKHTLDAATGPSVKLVKASLMKKIHADLECVRNLSIQMTCILKFIAYWAKDHSSMIQLLATIKSFLQATIRLLNALETFKAVDAKIPEVIQREKAKSFDAVDVWEEPSNIMIHESNVKNGKVVVGTWNQLIRKLTSGLEYDNRFLRIFIITYRSFSTPWELLEKLKEVFAMPQSASIKPEEKLPTQLRVVTVVKHWIQTQIDDFDDDLIEELQEFILTLSKQDPLKRAADDLQRYLADLIVERSSRTNFWFQEPVIVDIPEGGLCLSDLFLYENPKTLAEQLTIIDFATFQMIEPMELLNQSWNKIKLKHRAPNIVSVIQRSTQFSFWVATMIMTQDVVSNRVRMFEHMINIGKHLVDMNNYNTLMGVIAGLNLAAVHRLKSISNKVSKEVRKGKEAMELIMSPDNNYSNYRPRLQKMEGPCLPYLGVYLKDLTFIEDGNNDFSQDGLINFRKRELIVDSISQIQQFQQTDYNLELVEPFFTFLKELPALEDADLFSVSKALEPKKK